jgi:acetyl-CoA C-acetyltransferase
MGSTHRVAVVGSAQTELAPAHRDRQHIDLITEAVEAALKGTGLRIDDVDFVIDSGSDFLDGRSISNCGFLGAMAAHHKEESRVEEDGLWALRYAYDKIAGGSAQVGLVVAYSKPSESDVRNYWTGLLEPFVQRPLGFDHEVAAGLVARQYLRGAGLDVAALDAVAEHSWKNAAVNPYITGAGQGGGSPGEAEVVASPLRRADFARPADGAVAVVVASAAVAGQIAGNPVWITGIGSAIDQHSVTARSGDGLPAASIAVESALSMSGLASVDLIDLVEVSATSTVGELMLLEALGFADKFKGIELYRSGDRSWLNPSGGALPADVIMATGLVRLHEAALRLARRPGYEDAAASRALVHGTGGFAMQNHCVVTLEVA